MPNLVTNLPRWLRIVVVGVATTASIGGGWFVYRHFTKPVILTVATGSSDGEAQLLTSAISARLTASGAHVRLKVVNAGSSAGASEMLAGGRADLAVVRGDTAGLSDARSVLLLSHGVVLIVAPSTVSAEGLGDLRNTTIGVIGGEANRTVVEALKQVYQFDRAKVSFQNVAVTEAAAALSSGKVHALLAVVPLTEKYLAKVREMFQQNGGKGSAPKLIEIASAGAIANVA
ncbi:ABC transporter substrate-binding protein [Bradyrhizobium sp. RT3b]